MISTSHQSILRRVRRSADRRGYRLKRFTKHYDTESGTQYRAYDRYVKGAYVLVEATYSSEPIEQGGEHHEVLTDRHGCNYTVLYMGARELARA